MGENGLSIADALALAKGNGDNDFSGNSLWWIIIIVLFFGWGGNGNWGNNRSNGSDVVVVPNTMGSSCCPPATLTSMTDAFNFQTLDGDVRGTHDAVVDGFYQTNLAVTNLGTAIASGFAGADRTALQNTAAIQNGLCNGFNSVNTNLNNMAFGIQNGLNTGFNGVQSAIASTNYAIKDCCCENRQATMQTNYNNQAGFNAVTTAIATNACDIERGQDDIRYLMAQNQSQTLVSIDKLGDRLIDYMNQKEMDELRTELQNAKFQISQSAQTEQLLNQLQPISRPAYITASPYQSLNYNAVNGCGCGNF